MLNRRYLKKTKGGKLKSIFYGPSVVVEKRSDLVYRITTTRGPRLYDDVNVERIKKYHQRVDEVRYPRVQALPLPEIEEDADSESSEIDMPELDRQNYPLIRMSSDENGNPPVLEPIDNNNGQHLNERPTNTESPPIIQDMRVEGPNEGLPPESGQANEM